MAATELNGQTRAELKQPVEGADHHSLICIGLVPVVDMAFDKGAGVAYGVRLAAISAAVLMYLTCRIDWYVSIPAAAGPAPVIMERS